MTQMTACVHRGFPAADHARYNRHMVSSLTRAQVRKLDQLAIDRYGIPGILLMENAGRGAASLIAAAYGPGGRAMVLCGTGNNGGDGCVIARHLHNAGWIVRVLIAGDRERMTDDTRVNFGIVEAMGLERQISPRFEDQRCFVEAVTEEDVVIDALLGTGFSGQVRQPTSQLIDAINNATPRATVAIDVPSGLDCDTGSPSNATIRADLTITFVAEKAGFSSADALPFVGRLEVVDIGAPRELIAEVTADV